MTKSDYNTLCSLCDHYVREALQAYAESLDVSIKEGACKYKYFECYDEWKHNEEVAIALTHIISDIDPSTLED